MPLDLSRPAALLAGARRHVLRRRRSLAAVLTATAVASALAATSDPPPALVRVAVASRDLPAGEVLGADDVAVVGFAPGSVPAGLAQDPAGQVLAAPLTRGQALTEVALVGPAMTGDRTDLRALPVRLPDAGAVGLLRVGDEIDLIATDPQAGETETVALGALVLAVPAPDDATGPAGLPGRLVVVGVDERDLERLADAVTRAVVTFTWSTR